MAPHSYYWVLWLAVMAVGCGPSRPPVSDPGTRPEPASSEPTRPNPHAIGDADKCFGISNDFSGRLSDEQERSAPDELRGAFYVESVRKVTGAELSERTKGKTKLAEESRDGTRYVAVRDYRCVGFPNGASGMMIVIERYCVINE